MPTTTPADAILEALANIRDTITQAKVEITRFFDGEAKELPANENVQSTATGVL
ncbi:MAG TPA: hypothetical protein VN736_01085 [Candidatus Limnocylindrales bacterium]|nr:hypothetical protein [Candidatus Limnocylindrales bacterium]